MAHRRLCVALAPGDSRSTAVWAAPREGGAEEAEEVEEGEEAEEAEEEESASRAVRVSPPMPAACCMPAACWCSMCASLAGLSNACTTVVARFWSESVAAKAATWGRNACLQARPAASMEAGEEACAEKKKGF